MPHERDAVKFYYPFWHKPRLWTWTRTSPGAGGATFAYDADSLIVTGGTVKVWVLQDHRADRAVPAGEQMSRVPPSHRLRERDGDLPVDRRL